MGMASPPTRGPVGSVGRSADSEVAPLANGATQRYPAAEDQTGPWRYNLLGPCRLQVCRVAFRWGVLCCGLKLCNAGECKNPAAVASATGAVPAPSARKKQVKAKRPKKNRKMPTKSGGKQEEEHAGEGDKEDAGVGDKEDTEKKDEVAVEVSGTKS